MKTTKTTTTKLTSFDRDACRLVRSRLEDVMKEVAREFGIAIEALNGTFNGEIFTVKIQCAVRNKAGAAASPAATAFKTYAKSHGMSPSDIGRTFSCSPHGTFTITGLSPKSWKMPILARSERTQKTHKFSAEYVRRLLRD